MISPFIFAALTSVTYCTEAKFEVTAYCSCAKCCGKWADGKTASGKKVAWGMVAADWKVLPKGTKLMIQGLKGTFTVEDKGGAIKGKRIDVWFPNHKAALVFGRRKGVSVQIIRRR